jgi:hypothetical protein
VNIASARERLKCRLQGHAWQEHTRFGPGEVETFAVCTRCGALNERGIDGSPKSG